MSRVFLITGCSSGLGHDYCQEVINQGDYIVATARRPETLKFEGATEENCLCVRLDVTCRDEIARAYQQALTKFGRVDVVVNNAGYGLSGAFEGYTEEQMRDQMEINFFGLMHMTKKALEVMRAQSPPGGVIQQVTSITAQRGAPTTSMYCASKWAVEGFSEAIRYEMKPQWNIKINIIEPGGIRTDWAGRSMQFGAKHPAYDHIDAKAHFRKHNGVQVGDPKKMASVMWEVTTMKHPPLRLVLGSDAYGAIMAKIKGYDREFKKHEELAKSTDADGNVLLR